MSVVPYEMAFQKKVFTTGMVAAICCVATRTVSKWVDSKRLRGYRLPGCYDRRIPREALVRFMNELDMPIAWLHDYERKLAKSAETETPAPACDTVASADHDQQVNDR